MKKGLPPFIPPKPTVLILGSLPGDKSIELQQYYGHPRNRFWFIISSLAGKPVPEDYSSKLELLSSLGIILWDVYESAERTGSLDSDIRTPNFNDISSLLKSHPVRKICTNGATAAKALSLYPNLPTSCQVVNLPSTSPANATWTTEKLLTVWKEAIL